jgi:hypothetical protein
MALTKVTYSMIDGPAVNLMDYIPLGTNTATTDCTAFVQAAIDAAKGVAKLEVPGNKTFLVSNLEIYAGTQIVGVGTTPIFDFSAAGRNVLYAIKNNDVGNAFNVVLDNICLQGNDTAQNGWYIQPGYQVYNSYINIKVTNFNSGVFHDGSCYASTLIIEAERCFVAVYRTNTIYNTSVDLTLRAVFCFNGLIADKWVYSQMSGYFEAGGLSALAELPASRKPTNEVPVMLQFNSQCSMNITSFGAENTNGMYLYAGSSSDIRLTASYLRSIPADSWVFDAARVNNLGAGVQGLFSVQGASHLALDSFSFINLIADGYPLPSVTQSYLFRIQNDSNSSISLSNMYVNAENYWVTEAATQRRLIWDNSGQFFGTMPSGSAYINTYGGINTPWTPTLKADGTNFSSVTYDAVTAGEYAVIGDLVTFTGRLRTDAVAGGSGSIYIDGLPLAAIAPTSGVALGLVTGWASNTPLSAYVIDQKIYLQYRATLGGDTAFVPAASAGTGANANEINFFGSYFI